MRKPAIMFQGTGSNVGKSLLVAGLCRAFLRRGLKVMPFKPQNMSNNAAVAADGGEIGRAQALQALAAGVPPSVHMNPVLLKPESDTGSQVIVQGRRRGSLGAQRFGSRRDELLPLVLDSFARLEQEADLIVIEGAGSPAEVNLRAGDIANMGFAEAADVPVILIGDIDRGGVIASIVGTHAVLEYEERKRIKSFIINKFRGEIKLFYGGMSTIAERTGWHPLGIVPWFHEAVCLPAEDAVDLEALPGRASGRLKIAVPILSRIANFDDFDPLKQEPGVELVMVPPGSPLPGDARLVILPGTKATISDLGFLRAQGWDIDLQAHLRRGGRVLGICGGYQMLGRLIADPEGVEGEAGDVPGLGFLDVETVMTPEKITTRVAGMHFASGEAISGYEIHIGRTNGPDCTRPLVEIDGTPDGASSADGLVSGTYLHGFFASDAFRAAYLETLGVTSGLRYGESVEAVLNRLAEHCERHLDLDAVLAIARTRAT
ncbi:MAG TPA: cobyric acid synthase [Rhabdaerophilum sp.]|nr:cobyric acid synthase [Rhabdaerophilum sp.]